MSSIREPSHAGSWYSDDAAELNQQLNQWLNKVGNKTEDLVDLPIDGATAIISPHAGYSYSGQAAAFGFKAINVTHFNKVFILGPSHHFYLKKCAVSGFKNYGTPFGNLKIDEKINEELLATNQFDTMSPSTDEAEHSIEMQLPYIYKIFQNKINDVTIIPILVGDLSTSDERRFGEILSPYFKDPNNLFVISSDFCHWGSRFRYQFYTTHTTPSSQPTNYYETSDHTLPIHKAIENLDREGISKIGQCQLSPFKCYLETTENTICGRHPIAILLAIIEQLFPIQTRNYDNNDIQNGKHIGSNPILKFIHYSQSSNIISPKDSSVSYASGYFFNSKFEY